MHLRYLILLSASLLLKTFFLIFAILYAGIGLGPDEAQYWTWSQALDFGYYSKPPGIAWEIALGTWLFGNTELGVRAMPLLIGFILPFGVYAMAKRCLLPPIACFWAAVAMAYASMGILASFLAITDGGMILFWTVACAYLAGKIEQKKEPNYILIGALICCGALFKWPIYGLWLAILGSWAWFSYLISWRLFFGVIVSALGLLPSLYWNATHEWATFRHVWATVTGGHAQPKRGAVLSGNLLEFLGSQSALVSPILFILLILAWQQMIRRGKDLPNGILFCGGVSFVSVAIGAMMAFFMKMQGNWAIFAYPTAFVLLSWYVFDGSPWKKKWLVGGVIFSLLACTAVFSIPWIQSHNIAPGWPLPYKINPFRHNIGWNKLAAALTEAGYDPEQDFLFGDKYQTASILSFYGPDQKRAYYFNLQGSRKNQFSFWPGISQEQQGKRGFFVVIENIPQLNNQALPEKYRQELIPYFDEVRVLGVKPLFEAYGSVAKGLWLLQGDGYRGGMPPETDLY